MSNVSLASVFKAKVKSDFSRSALVKSPTSMVQRRPKRLLPGNVGEHDAPVHYLDPVRLYGDPGRRFLLSFLRFLFCLSPGVRGFRIGKK
jgi:hypothetical protein